MKRKEWTVILIQKSLIENDINFIKFWNRRLSFRSIVMVLLLPNICWIPWKNLPNILETKLGI